MTELTTVALDVETTGFAVDDQLTVAGFDSAVASRVFLNTGGRDPVAGLTGRVNEGLRRPVRLSIHECERDLLTELSAFVTSTLAQRDAKLVAYNGERWSGGFDLPFVRTRLCTRRLEWPFGNLPYADAMDAFETRFNTTETTLDAVYTELIDGELTEVDPFADSAEAVTAWEDGAFAPLIRHNVADVRRTRALMDLAERYCSKSDFSMKSLDPVA